MEEFEQILAFLLSKEVIRPLFIILGSVLVYMIVSRVIRRMFRINFIHMNVRKNKTMCTLTVNVFKYFVILVCALMLLDEFGVDTKTLVASLGVVGVVLGLACQDIAKDFLAGIFNIFNEAYAVGDTVKINGFTGEVIEAGLKDTKIKAYTGEVLTISNSTFTEVINYSAANSKLVLDINVSYNTNIDKLESILEAMFDDIKSIENVCGEVELLGVSSLSDSSVVYSILIECKPMTYIGVKRKVLKLIKENLDKHKIEIPYNKLDIYVKEK